MRSDLFEAVGGDVGGGEARLEALDVDDDAVLAVDAGDAAGDALEGTVGDADDVVGDEAALLDVDLHDMLVAEGRCPDQWLHVTLGDGQRRVLPVGVGLEVVVVVGYEARRLDVMDIRLGLLLRDIGEEQVQEGHQHAPLLTVAAHVLPYHGEVGVDMVVDHQVGHLLGMAIEDAEDVPRLVWRRRIPHRHPCL